MKRFPFSATVQQAQALPDNSTLKAYVAYKKPHETWDKAGFVPMDFGPGPIAVDDITFCDACYDICDLRIGEVVPAGEDPEDYGCLRLAQFEDEVRAALVRGESFGIAHAGNLGAFEWRLAIATDAEVTQFASFGQPFVKDHEYKALVQAAEQLLSRTVFTGIRAERIIARLVRAKGFVRGFRQARTHAGDLALQAVTDAAHAERI